MFLFTLLQSSVGHGILVPAIDGKIIEAHPGVRPDRWFIRSGCQRTHEFRSSSSKAEKRHPFRFLKGRRLCSSSFSATACRASSRIKSFLSRSAAVIHVGTYSTEYSRGLVIQLAHMRRNNRRTATLCQLLVAAVQYGMSCSPFR